MTPRHPARHRGDGGFSLVEVLFGMMISAAIVVPLCAWMILGYQQQATITAQSHDDNAANRLSLHLPRDVASAAIATPGGTDCASGATVVLELRRSATSSLRVVYAVSEENVGGRLVGTLLRRECEGTSDVSALEISDELTRPTGGWADLVRCSPPSGQPDACREVEVTLTGRRGRPMSVTATRRLGGT